jgi:myb proto-oncogene protein
LNRGKRLVGCVNNWFHYGLFSKYILVKHNSGKECHNRWKDCLKPGSKKGQWTEAEDQILSDVILNSKEDPFTRWRDLAQKLPGRSPKQIRERWVNHLNPNINHQPFTKEDDLTLWEAHCALGKRWVDIRAKYYNSTRSENQIKVIDILFTETHL